MDQKRRLTGLQLIERYRGTEALRKVFREKLTDREAHVLELRYESHEKPSQAYVGQLLGISQGRVCNLETAALRKLQHPSVLEYFK